MKLSKTAIIGCSAITLSTFVSSVPVPALAQNLVQNGGFVPTDLSQSAYLGTNQVTVDDWNFHDGYTFLIPDGTAVSTNINAAGYDSSATGNPISLYPGNGSQTVDSVDGSGWYIAADGASGTEPITQTVTGLTVGQQYTLTFSQAAGQQTNFTGATSDDWLVSFGSSVYTSPTINLASKASVTGWQQETTTFTATSTNEVLSFLAQGAPSDPPFALLSGVSLTPANQSSSVPEPSYGFGLGAIIALGLGVGLKKSKLANKK